MRPDWDADSPELRRNLTQVLQTAEAQSYARAPLNLDTARRWQREIIEDLAVPHSAYIGAFRGEPGLEKCQVHIPDADQTNAVIELCAWAHGEWVRIHPFANANGRTARLWVNSLAMRYCLPPFLRLRPRPQGDYAAACAQAMAGNWMPTVTFLHQLLNDLP